MKKIVTIGGGTGNFTVLSGLKDYPHELAAIVSMSDDGGSTGVLRTELGVLPPGDVRQCLVALSRSSALLRDLFTYRFESGRFAGANFGNLFLSALEKVTGDFDTAVLRTGEILRIRGQVIPVTTENVTLVAGLPGGGSIRGEAALQGTDLRTGVTLTLDPFPRPNPRAVAALAAADLIVIGPGDLYSSIIPNLLVSGISDAIRASRARKIYIANLMTKPNHTPGWHVADYVREIERYLGVGTIQTVLWNNVTPPADMVAQYARQGELPVATHPEGFAGSSYEVVGTPLLKEDISTEQKPNDPLARSLIRHDSKKLATILVEQLLNT